MENSVIDKERDQVVSNPNLQENQIKNTLPSAGPDGSNVNLNDFLNPRSMLTPGVAGSMVMVIANTLWVQFMIPQKWSALTLSFLLIIPVLIRFSATIFENIIYFIFNSLIVFALAVNTNFVGAKLSEISGSINTVSSEAQKINAALKNLNTVATHDQKIKIINQMQLASNDDQVLSNLRLVADEQKNVKSDASHQGEQKKDQKHKEGQHRDNRKFFGKWF